MLQQRLTRNLYTGQTEPLTAPLSFDFTEDLGDKRNLSLFSQYGGAAAAYSLRALGSYNEKVVRVRRESDNDEKDFTAPQVSSGELVNWVNAETTLPLDLRELESDGRTGSVIPAAAAYSLRNLSADGTEVTPTGDTVSAPDGNYVVQVRRETDDSLKSFTADGITFGEMLAWVKALDPSSSGFVSKWYDQSGNDRHATQTSLGSQPIIVDAGVLVESDNKPAIKFNGTSSHLRTSDYIVELSQNSASVFAVSSPSSAVLGKFLLVEADSAAGSSNFALGGTGAGNAIWVNSTTFGTTKAGKTLIGFDYDAVNFQAYIDGTASGAAGSATVNSETLGYTTIGANGPTTPSQFFTGTISEIITYKSDRSEDRTALESNIGDHYGISGPIYPNNVSGFVETWYDQSGNGNDATQTTTSLQPKIVDDGDLFTLNGKPSFKFTSISTQRFDLENTISGISDFSTFFVSEVTDRSGRQDILSQDSSNFLRMRDVDFQLEAGGVDNGAFAFNSVLTDGDQFSLGFIRASNTLTAYVDGTAQSNTDSNSSNLSINKILGRGTNFVTWINKVQELILYTSDKSSDRTAIEDNINAHYNIYS